MATRLLEDDIARVDEHDGQVSGRRAVTMLCVYCTCPGVSAMMNFRRAVTK